MNERQKKIADAVAVAATNPLVPAAVRVGFACMAEELSELGARVATLEQGACGETCECEIGKCQLKGRSNAGR